MSPSEFRAQAEFVIAPLLQRIMRAMQPPRDYEDDTQKSTSLQLYGAPSLLPAAGFSASRLQPSADSAAAGFLPALLQRTLKHITG